jgi:hypothetical protein
MVCFLLVAGILVMMMEERSGHLPSTVIPGHAQREPGIDLLILRSIAKRCVSKDEATTGMRPGLMVRDGARAPPHHEG